MRYRSLVALAALCAAGPASAATYTVATNGSDAGDGVGTPFRTLQKAAGVLRDGDTIVFQPGTYTAGAWIERRNITLRGNGTVVLDGTNGTRDDGVSFYQTSGITIENLKLRNCRRYGLFVVLSRGVTIRNCDASNNGKSGILTGNSSDVLIEGCTAANNKLEHGIYLSQSGDRLQVVRNSMWGNTRCGLQINAVQDSPNSSDPNNDSLSKECLVEGNTIYANGSGGGAGINLAGVQNSTLVNNLIHSNLAGGIALWDDGAGSSYGSKNNRILHNTIVFAQGRGRFGVQCVNGSTGNQIYNNILVSGSGPAIETDSAVQSDFNCFWAPSIANGGSLAQWRNSTRNDLNSQEGDPGLAADYRLAPGSPARDAALGGLADTDHDGRLRPQGANPDVGCFEGDGDGAGEPPPPDPEPEPVTGMLYDEGLAAGWSALVRKASCQLNVQSPVGHGTIAMGVTVTGKNGYVILKGQPISLGGKQVLRFLLHGGTTGDQQLRVRPYFDGKVAPVSVNVWSYGGKPVANQWVEVTIPLSVFRTTGAGLTAVKIFAGKKQKQAYVDCIRVE